MKPTIQKILSDYRSGSIGPRELISAVRNRILTSPNQGIWIHVLDESELEPYLQRLDTIEPGELPLYGVPFAIKDNIDLAGVPTTAACPDYSYVPRQSATVVQRLIDAGAVPVGKTNLDQFATGLVGTRSPYPIPVNPLAMDRIPGGSSSGSAVALSEGLVPFSLGTDTAGSGRVPAAFNGLWGLKPSRGRLSAAGVVPACRSLDCVSIFANSADDCECVLKQVEGADPRDAFTRPPNDIACGKSGVIGIPRPQDLSFFGDAGYASAWKQALEDLKQMGWELVEIDFSAFIEAARLLYEGPWVSERYAAIEDFLGASADSLHPVTRKIILGGADNTALDLFKSQYRLEEIKQLTKSTWDSVVALVTPTAGGFPTLDEVRADPVGVNTMLGYYTNFMNLLDLCAIASPSVATETGLPFGITWIAPRDRDMDLLQLASKGPQASNADDSVLTIVLFGAHMKGLSLNDSVQALGATFNREVRTAPIYKMIHLENPAPRRPGIVRTKDSGHSLIGEAWDFPIDSVGSFLAQIQQPLGLGQIQLEDGSFLHGFLCESIAAIQADDISEYGGWRSFCLTAPVSR